MDYSTWVMANGKTLVLALFPASKLKNPIIWKRLSLFTRQRANKKIAILVLTLNLTHLSVTLALTLMLMLTQTQNLNPNPNDNNFKKE